jgi:UDP-glucose 4-epimerase
MSRLRLVVTGASGFIGGHLLERVLNDENFEVFGLSRSGAKNTTKVTDYVNAPDGDILIHLAEDNNAESVAKQGRTYETQVLGTLNSLLNKKYSRVIYASSSAIYGENSKYPHCTDSNVYSDTPYRHSKAVSEDAVLSSNKGVVARIANVYGPRMSNSSVLSQILNQINLDSDLVIRERTPIRDFIWVGDVISGIMQLATHDLSDNPANRIYNLGTGVGTSIGNLARKTLDLAGQPSRGIVATSLIENPSSIILDYRKTTLACGWSPKTNLHDGLVELVASISRVRKQ